MQELIGNFWTEVETGKYEAICCTTNKIVKTSGGLVMGAGIAKEFQTRYPELPSYFGTKLAENPKLNLMVYDGKRCDLGYYVIAFPTKHDWRESSSMALIEHSALELKHFADCFGIERVLMTRPGCGLGGLTWSGVKQRIERYLDDRFVVIERN